MKRLFALFLTLSMLLTLAACGNSTTVDEALSSGNSDDNIVIPLGDTGVKVAIPFELGFEAYESEINDFYGGGPNGEWRIIVNSELKSDYADYTLEKYAELSAQANEGVAAQDADGNYYFTYTNKLSDDETYKFYTAVREDADKYYRVGFYCFEEYWATYGDQFSEWAKTIEIG